VGKPGGEGLVDVPSLQVAVRQQAGSIGQAEFSFRDEMSGDGAMGSCDKGVADG